MGMIKKEVEHNFFGFALIDGARLAQCADLSASR